MIWLGRLLVIVATMIAALAWAAMRSFLGNAKRHKRKRPITILKPMKGDSEFGLLENLTSFFEMTFMEGDEIIFCFETEDDPGIKLVESLQAKFPYVPVRITKKAVRIGVNPKIQNMWEGYKTAKNDLILISDSNTLVKPYYLALLDDQHKYDTGVLAAVIICNNATSLAGRVESMLMHRFYSKWMVLLNSIGHSIVMGKSMMFSKSALEACGGFFYASKYLAEDYVIGQMLSNSGYYTHVLSIPVTESVGKRSFREVFMRYVRWGRMRKAHAPVTFMLEPLSSMTVMSWISIFVFPWWVGLVLSTIWAWFETDMIHYAGGKNNFLAYMVSEWLIIPIWIYTLCGNAVEWRGRIFDMNDGGTCDERPS